MLEGVANVRHAATLMASVLGCVALVVAGAVWTDARAAGQVLAAESAYLADGGDLLVAYAPDGSSVDAAACERLTDVTGVRAAGTVSIGLLATGLVGRPEVSQTVVTVSPGVEGLLADRGRGGLDDLVPGPEAAARTAWVAPTLAGRWAWDRGASLALTGGEVDGMPLPTGVLTVAGVVDPGVLDEAASTGVLLLRPAVGPAQRCFLRVEPPYRGALVEVVPSLLGDGAGRQVQVVERLPAGAGAGDPGAAYELRPTRWAGAAAGLVVGLLWCVIGWTRRGRAALYDTLGVRAGEALLVRWTEGAVVLVVGVVWGVAWGVSSVVVSGVPQEVAMELGLACGALAVGTLAPLVLAAAAWRPRTLVALKDR